MPNEQLHFTTRVLGPAAAFKLEKRQVTQTLRSKGDIIPNAFLLGRVSPSDRLVVLLDGLLVGKVKLLSMHAITWEALSIDDAHRGGFDTLPELENALQRAGYRFKPMDNYHFYRIQFTWLEEVYA